MKWLDRILGSDSQTLGRHSLMLGSLILMLVALPLLEWSPGRHLRFPILFGLVLFAAIWVNQTKHWVLWAAVVIGIGAIAGNMIAFFTASPVVRIAADLIGLALLVLTTLVILRSIVIEREVELDTVIGGICAYLLIGVCFATIYRLLVDTVPAAFVIAGEPLEASLQDTSSLPARLLYFSFITLTTTGYGDITPNAEIAQMLAAGEALIGQLYVAIFIARLMGLHIEAGRPRTDCDDPPTGR
ncbi:MAG: potassium channel family protein [Myxococcota bacterium]